LKPIDLRSDTVTQPTEEMRQAMATATVGDDVYEDDPTVIQLQKTAAEMTGFEDALFVPSGTMANQIAIMAYTKRGDEIILGGRSHIAVYEVGAAAVLSGVGYRLVNNGDDMIYARDVEEAVRVNNIHFPETGLVCLENALSNGTVVPLDTMKETYNAAKECGVPVYLDGARLFNAAVYLNVPTTEITRYCDAVMFCLSKGLCAPVGSVLCGDGAFIKKARKYRKMLGGGMRQVGVLAACGLVALEKMTKRLYVDHGNAQYLAEELAVHPYIELDREAVHINLVFFKIKRQGFDHGGFFDYLSAKGIKINRANGNEYRLVTHNDVNRDDIKYTLDVIKEYI
jgi:threonine aldolase